MVAALFRFCQLIEEGQEAEKNRIRLEHYHKTYLGVLDPMSLRTSLKLKLNRNNHAHFSDIAKEPYTLPKRMHPTATNRNLDKAYEFFRKRLSNFDGDQLVALVGEIADGLLFTVITVKDDLDAYLVFETMNARGVHLSAPDLLKNYLLSVMAADTHPESEVFEHFNEDWSEVVNQLGETNFTSFLRSRYGMTARLPHKKDLYRVLKKEIKTPRKVVQYLAGIKDHALVYAALQNPDSSFWGKYKDGECKACTSDLVMLKLFNIKTPLSLLMAAYEKLPPADFNKMVRWIAVVSIRYNVICSKLANEQEDTYNAIAKQIMKGVELRRLKAELKPVYPQDEEFVSAFSNKSMPGRRSSKRIVYLLKTIEERISKQPPPSRLTLEHVLPYNPEDPWQESFGRDVYSEAIDRLGNVALLPENQNRDLEQKPFAQKRMLLKQSGFKINHAIAEHNEWNMEVLNHYQKWLSKQAQATWRIDSMD